MDKAEKEHIAEMNRIRVAMTKTKSKYLLADYSKALKRMNKELSEYRRFKNAGC